MNNNVGHFLCVSQALCFSSFQRCSLKKKKKNQKHFFNLVIFFLLFSFVCFVLYTLELTLDTDPPPAE